ncbi:MAG: dihydrofolate reductase family protein [Deltaproteobacteria bacterium]
MAKQSRVLVYIACSFDGFIAGPGDDLSWLPGADPSAPGATAPEADPDSKALGFEAFMSGVGALLMGRRSYEVVAGFGGVWPYGKRPVLVATHRPLQPISSDVRAVAGEIAQLIALARDAAGELDVYLDGGNLIRQALDAGLVDDLVVTLVPVLLGEGYPLFAGVRKRHALELVSHQRFGGGLLQVQLRPKPQAPP